MYVKNEPILIGDRIGWRSIVGEVVTFNCNTQDVVIWNSTASFLLELIAEGCDARGLEESLARRYSINLEDAKKGVASFLLDEVSSFGIIGESAMSVQKDAVDITSEDGEHVLLDIEMRAIEHLVPMAVTFETTYACNEHCIHCYMDRGLKSLSFDQIGRILGELAESECLFLSLTGGEFLARKDASEIVKLAGDLHFVIDILSNGTLVSEDLAELFRSQPVRRFQISLYGASAGVHDSITGLQGSFSRTLHGIKLLREAGVKVEIAYPLMGANFHERYSVKDLVGSLGCVLSPSHMITARNNGLRDTLDLRITDEQLADFLGDKELSGMYSGRRPFQDHQLYFDIKDLRDAAPCYSGFNTCAINPQGKVYPCNQLLLEVGDLTHQSFADVWYDSPSLKRLRGVTVRDTFRYVRPVHF